MQKRNKWIVINGKKESRGIFDYEVGEIITFNSVEQRIKCVRIEPVGDEILYHFIKPRLVWDGYEE